MLIKYVRDLHNQSRLVGCVVAIGSDKIGWSQCNPVDKFDKQRALKIAIGRAQTGSNVRPHPYYMYKSDGTRYSVGLIEQEMLVMERRARRYYKQLATVHA
jgi:hypothetical protein